MAKPKYTEWLTPDGLLRLKATFICVILVQSETAQTGRFLVSISGDQALRISRKALRHRRIAQPTGTAS